MVNGQSDIVGLQYFQSLLFFWKKKIDETETKYESKPFSCPWKIFVALVTFSILNVPVQVYDYALFLNPVFLVLPSPTSDP